MLHTGNKVNRLFKNVKYDICKPNLKRYIKIHYDYVEFSHNV